MSPHPQHCLRYTVHICLRFKIDNFYPHLRAKKSVFISTLSYLFQLRCANITSLPRRLLLKNVFAQYSLPGQFNLLLVLISAEMSEEVGFRLLKAGRQIC